MSGKPAVQLGIAPAAGTYEVGQPIRVRVAAVALQDISIREARADLVQKFWLNVPEFGTGEQPQRIVTGTGSWLRLPGAVPVGARAECEAVLPNWAQAPTGGPAPLRRIGYSVRAELVLDGGVRVRREAPVRLVSGPSLYKAVEGTTRRHRSRQCDLELIIPAWRARPGESIHGMLRVVPKRPFRVRLVVLYLRPRQSLPKGPRQRAPALSTFIQRHRLARNTALSAPSEFPFEVRLPGDACPTLITTDLWVRWYLQAFVQYGVLRADWLEREVNLYNRPS